MEMPTIEAIEEAIFSTESQLDSLSTMVDDYTNRQQATERALALSERELAALSDDLVKEKASSVVDMQRVRNLLSQIATYESCSESYRVEIHGWGDRIGETLLVKKNTQDAYDRLVALREQVQTGAKIIPFRRQP